MKFISIKALALIAVLTVSFSACEQSIPPIGEPFGKLEGINGTWVLNKVTQTDELTLSLNNSIDVSAVFIGNDPTVLTFNSSDFTYTITNGTPPEFLGTSGTWSFENESDPALNNDYPTHLILNSGGNTLSLPLNRTVRIIDNTLEFNLPRTCNGKLGMSYNYVFARQ
jgi:hypothetical protein